ncbi:MAG TPA: CPBP family intramembrane metalloprotease [Anaerolineales bacterium]|nr:CPBP family intramembrane metalloprotease [Anaerolineales bacterium]HNA89737.1 CPBP family intramembrane metalloprotease [Anaerolineales bacterium]HNC08920.1 CPBP family intramembrane metalloprotease [Anaerolineales bacterium]
MSGVIISGYVVIYLVVLGIAIRNRRSFPLSESIMVILIIGVGFTGLVYFLAPRLTELSAHAVSLPELLFTLAYLVGVSLMLVFVDPVPSVWKDDFFKRKLVKLCYKLILFVVIPLLVLRLVWDVNWNDLGFSIQKLPHQILAALVLSLCFGGFNYIAGSGAKPIRAGEFSVRQLTIWFPLVFLWNMLEVGLVEEFFFRAFLQTRLTHVFGSSLAGICAASLLFGLAHAPGLYLRNGDKGGPLGEQPTLLNAILYSILVLSPAGWFTGLLFVRTQSLLAPILVHAAIDTVAHVSEFIQATHTEKSILTRQTAL